MAGRGSFKGRCLWGLKALGFRILTVQAQNRWPLCPQVLLLPWHLSYTGPSFHYIAPLACLPQVISLTLLNLVISSEFSTWSYCSLDTTLGWNPGPQLHPPAPALLPGSLACLYHRHRHPPTCSSWKLEILLDTSLPSPPHPTAKPNKACSPAFLSQVRFAAPLSAHTPFQNTAICHLDTDDSVLPGFLTLS